MTDIVDKIRKIKLSRLSDEEKLLYKLDDTKVVHHLGGKYTKNLPMTKILLAPNNDVLVECFIKEHHNFTIRFNYNIIWVPFILEKN